MTKEQRDEYIATCERIGEGLKEQGEALKELSRKIERLRLKIKEYREKEFEDAWG